MRPANGLLMVTQDSDLFVRLVVGGNLFGNRPLGGCELVELVLESVGSVVGTEYFGSQAFHVAAQVFVQAGRL